MLVSQAWFLPCISLANTLSAFKPQANYTTIVTSYADRFSSYYINKLLHNKLITIAIFKITNNSVIPNQISSILVL